jgi:hypothetical protein
VPLDEYNTSYMHRRIHPEDEHLQYGPVSTALHQIVKTGKEPSNLSGILALTVYLHESTRPCDDLLHRDLFLMFWAEFLADEGM